MQLFRFFSRLRIVARSRLRLPFLSVAVAAGLSVLPAPASGQDQGQKPGGGQGAALGAARLCREDIRSFCGDLLPGGGRIAACLRGNADSLSESCRDAISSLSRPLRRPAREALPKDVNVTRDIAYGDDPAQTFDVYRPAEARNAPVIVMLHGGAWAFGSKQAAGVIDNKVRHFLPKGYLFVSVETRLLPKADPLQQADDLAHALAQIEAKAASWGGDAGKLVLIGHSAGAHLAALVSADPAYARRAGARPWLATIALDSAAYDIAPIMRGMVVPQFYRDAFGSDPDFWEKASPTRQISGKAPKMLLVCSSFRRWSCRQAQTFAKKMRGQGEVLPVDLRHMQINAQLGADNDYTQRVDGFLHSLGLP